jgi:hypothetical protein
MVGLRDESSLAATSRRPFPCYAAVSITGKNVADGSLSGKDIRNGSVRGADVRNGSLSVADLSAGAISSLRGAAGARGPTGPTGTFGAVTIRSMDYKSGPPVKVQCLSGEVAVGGGVDSSAPASWIRVSAPTTGGGTPTGWQGQAVNSSNVGTLAGVYAICAQR